MLYQANRPSRDGQLEQPFGHSNSYKQYFHNLRGRQTPWCLTHWNAVGKVKNTKLNNFRLVWLLHSLHSMRPSLWKSRGYVATPYLFHVVIRMFTCKTPATHVQLSRASSNHVIKRRPSSVYRYSQSFSTVKRKQITWQIVLCAIVSVDMYGAHMEFRRPRPWLCWAGPKSKFWIWVYFINLSIIR